MCELERSPKFTKPVFLWVVLLCLSLLLCFVSRFDSKFKLFKSIKARWLTINRVHLTWYRVCFSALRNFSITFFYMLYFPHRKLVIQLYCIILSLALHTKKIAALRRCEAHECDFESDDDEIPSHKFSLRRRWKATTKFHLFIQVVSDRLREPFFGLFLLRLFLSLFIFYYIFCCCVNWMLCFMCCIQSEH